MLRCKNNQGWYKKHSPSQPNGCFYLWLPRVLIFLSIPISIRPKAERGGVANGNADHPSPELEEIDNMHEATSIDRDPLAAGNARARDDAASSSWQRAANRDVARPPRPRSQSRPGLDLDLDRNIERNTGVDRAFPEGAVGERTRTYSGSSFQADRWDPAVRQAFRSFVACFRTKTHKNIHFGVVIEGAEFPGA